MKPSLSQMLMKSAQALGRDVRPHVHGETYAIATIGAAGTLMVLMAQEAERSVETLVREQDALNALFADAARAAVPDDLRARLLEAASAPADSLKLAALEARASAMNALLIDLQTFVEASPFDWAEAIERRIWEILRLGAACRALYLPTL